MKVDFIPETKPKPVAAHLNGFNTKQFMPNIAKICATLMVALLAKKLAPPPEPDDDSDEDSDEDSE